MTTIQKIKLPLNYDPPQIYCPACGTLILGNFESTFCTHMVFVTDPAGTGNDFLGEKYKKIFEELYETVEETNEDLIEKFLEAHFKESFLVFDIEFGGMSHSIEWYNITAIFDFAP